MSFEDQIRISTPEGVDLELTLAGLGTRIAASVLDALIRGAVYIAFFLIGAGIASVTPRVGGSIALGVILVLIFVTEIGYDIAFEVLGGGRTIGKRAVGIRVMKVSGAPVDFRASAVRNLLRLVDGPLTSWVVGVVTVLVSKRNQRLGDMVAGTIVARDRIVRPKATEINYVYARPELYPWDVGGVRRDDVGTLRRFLERRDALDPMTRSRIARQLYDRIRPMVGGVADELSPEAFIEEVVRIKSESDQR